MFSIHIINRIPYDIQKTRSAVRPLSGIQFSLRDRNRATSEGFPGFRPLSGNQFSLPVDVALNTPGYNEVSVPSRGINSHYLGKFSKEDIAAACFRPLSGNQFSLQRSGDRADGGEAGFRPLSGNNSHYRTDEEVARTCGLFSSPLGESILITSSHDAFGKLTYVFPSPLGESILITITKWRGSGMSQKVSVPSRGFNSHYDRREAA